MAVLLVVHHSPTRSVQRLTEAVVAGAPLLGLLGTVVGVMITFAAIAASTSRCMYFICVAQAVESQLTCTSPPLIISTCVCCAIFAPTSSSQWPITQPCAIFSVQSRLRISLPSSAPNELTLYPRGSARPSAPVGIPRTVA